MTTNPVLDSVQPVVDDMDYVSINDDAIDTYATELADEDDIDVPPWCWDGYPDQDWSDAERLQEIVLGCMNAFCFGHLDGDGEYATRAELPDDDAPQVYERSDGNWAAFKRGHTSDDYPDLLDAETLASMEYDEADSADSDVYRFFDPMDGHHIPMLQERHDLLQDAGETLQDRYNGSFKQVWEAADGQLYNNGDGFVERLATEFDGFHDAWEYDGNTVRFDKKAQLAANIAVGHFQFDDFFTPDDVDELQAIADYRLPQTLSHPDVDILEYADELREDIAQGRELPAGSQKELEIRAATVETVDRLLHGADGVAGINERRAADGKDPIGIPELDFLLWNAGRDLSDTRHHRTRTTAY